MWLYGQYFDLKVYPRADGLFEYFDIWVKREDGTRIETHGQGDEEGAAYWLKKFDTLEMQQHYIEVWDTKNTVAMQYARDYIKHRDGAPIRWQAGNFPYLGETQYADFEGHLHHVEFRIWDSTQSAALLTVYFVDGTTAEVKIPLEGKISAAPHAENGHSFRVLGVDRTTYTFNWLQIKYFAISQEAK